MNDLEIQCVDKTDRLNPHERIKAVGGRLAKPWIMPQEEAIKGIESGTYKFFVNNKGTRVDVVVSTSRYGHKYLKTVADGEQPDNLLSLASCPV